MGAAFSGGIMMRFSMLLLGVAAFAAGARGDVALAPLFTDHAVLQGNKPLAVWGRADAGERVTVSFRGSSASTVTGDDGRWIVYLERQGASSVPGELVATGKNTVRVSDVVVGEVWLCSGQSNMEWPVSRARDAAQEIASANNPLIRHVAIRQQVADKPADHVETSGWQLASPETAGAFSAVGYFFARNMQPRLGVPVGIVHSSWGGTQIESWMSAWALAGNPEFAVVGERWKKRLADDAPKAAEYDREMKRRAEAVEAAAKAGKPRPEFPWAPQPARHGSPHTPSGLFNGMINPLVPYALRGVLWYQGESNVGRASEYRALFPAMIRQWRENFGQGDIPFYWVQLANYKNGNALAMDYAFLREAQAKALSLPGTGQAVAIDIGDPDDIHPKNKQEVGRRLALIARAQVHGATVDCTGPVFAKAQREGASMRVSFSSGAEGLTADGKPLQSFELAGADKVFRSALARIEGDTVVVFSQNVKEPVAVRYAWRNAPVANLRNSAGLPAAPFRSDDW